MPMKYPSTPPRIDPMEQMAAYQNALPGAATASAIKRTSGGIGKNDDSANAIRNSAHAPDGFSANDRTHAYSLRIARDSFFSMP
jgi:hypothetical protein